MKKSRVIALLTAVMMIMSVIPAFANSGKTESSYFVDSEGYVYEKSGANLILNPGFEEGLSGITANDEYYEVSSEEAHSGAYSLKAIKSTKGEGAITAYFDVKDANESFYLSFWYKNTDKTAGRRPRVTFAFTDSSKTVPTVEDDFAEATNAWIAAGTASNDCDMEYSNGEWVQYSTVLRGNGNADACKYVVLNIYGLKNDVSFVDDFELYELNPSDEYSTLLSKALENWKKVTMPAGNLSGYGTISLCKDTGVDGVSVAWSSTTDAIDAETGNYFSPAEEELAVLTARLYVDGHMDDVYFEYQYPYIMKSMFDPYVEWLNNDVFAKLGSAVYGDINLPTEKSIDGYQPVTVSWSSSDESALSKDGKYVAPEITKTVDLVAKLASGNATKDVTKSIKVLGGNLVDDGLIMYYDFEKPLGSKSTLYDNSQKTNVYNATVDNVTIVDGYGKFSGGTIVLPENYATELTGSYSVSMWVNLDSAIATSGGMYRFFDFGGGQYSSQFLRYIPGTGQLSFMDRGTAGNGSTWAIDTTLTDMAQTWRLVSFTYEKGSTSSVATVYVDGQQLATSGSNTTLTNSIYQVASATSTNGFIGRTQWNNSENPDYMGLMDDVRIYNRAITADEIATLYEQTRPTVTAPVTIEYLDLEGNKLKDDVVVSADVNSTYEVPSSLRSLPSYSDGQNRYSYKYMSSKSTDSVFVTTEGENVCKLYFKLTQQTVGSNIIENGSFENGTTGWTNRLGTDIKGATVEYDNSIGANVMRLATLGKTSDQNIGTVWNVEKGKDYTISFDVYAGDVLTSENYQYNRLSDGYAIGDSSQRENSGQDIIAWGAALTASAWTHFEKQFTAATDVLYFQSSWSSGEMKFANFVLEEAGASSGNESSDDTKVPVKIKYVDVDGNLIKEQTIKINKGINDYTVADAYKQLEDKHEGGYVYKYTYNAKATGDGDTISISILRENVATLVYDVIKAKDKNLVTDGSFEDENGNFSWGTWESPERKTYFKDDCEDWFYKVNRDTNSAVLYKSSVSATDYALGTRWNDGTEGLCSMANFIPVKKGVTYLVSYDYKHKTAGANGSYISTSFVETKDYAAGSSGFNIPKNVSTSWQTNMFEITPAKDGYIYFHFSWLGSGSYNNTGDNSGDGPYWYFDNFEVRELVTFESKIEYADGYAQIVAEDGTEGYLVQAMYDEDGALASVVVSDKLTLGKEVATTVQVTPGAKLMLVKSLTTLEPITKAIWAK